MAVATLRVSGRGAPRTRHAVTAALAVTMTALTGAAVLSAGWTDGSLSALFIGVAGALEATALTLFRVPRSVAFGAPLVLLVATVMLPTVGTVPVPAHSGVLTVLHQYGVAGVSGLLGNNQWDFNVGLGALLWACGAWSVETALRGQRGALATAPVWAVLAVNVINAPAGGHAALPSTLAAATAILLIAAVQLERLNVSWGRRGVTVLPGTDSRFAVAGAAGGVLILLLAVLIPPVTSTDISGRLFSNAGSGPGGQGGAHSGADLSGTVRFNRSTVPGGPLTEVNTPVLTYITGAPSGAYLQMATDTVFASGTWLPGEDAVTADLIADTVPPGPIDRDRVIADGGVGADVTPLAASILMGNDASGDGTLPFPGEPDATSVAAKVSGLTVAGSLNGFVTIDSVRATDSVVGTPVTTTGTQSTATAEQLRAAGVDYPGFIDTGGFLALPDDGSGGVQTVHNLALQWTQSATNPYDQATAIENTLRDPNQFQYTLDPTLPAAGSNQWPIVYFLTTTHAGYCQYFASTMGAMLRSLGIPARLVNGYGPGRVSDSAITVGGAGLVRRVSSDDAHTWVEAYFPGYGWIPFEPTPPSTAGDYVPFERGGASPAATPSPRPGASHGPTKATPHGALAGDSAAGGGGGGTTGSLLLEVLVGAAAVLLLLALGGAWLARPRGIAGIWRRVGLVGRLLGARRDPSLTLDEYIDRVAGALPPSAAAHNRGSRIREALEEIGALSDRALYARTPPAADDAVRMRRAWGRIARLVPALGWRALVHRGTAAP